MTTIRVVLADDHTVVREGIRMLVEAPGDMRVIGELGDGFEALTNIPRLRPDVVVLDLSMPGLNGLDVTRQLSRKVEGLGILILTMHADLRFIALAFMNGARGYLGKEAAAEQLCEAIRVVADGEYYVGPGIPRDVLKLAWWYLELPKRRRHVLDLIAKNMHDEDIAEVVGVQVRTIQRQRASILREIKAYPRDLLEAFFGPAT